MENVTLIRDHARFTGPRTLDVGGDTLGADRIFINVGARASIPDLPGLDQVDAPTSSTMLDLDFLSEHLLIVGGS